MTAAVQSDYLAEHAWLLPDAQDWSYLSEAARRIQETRIAAALFKRRLPLLLHWRRLTIEWARERSRETRGVQVTQARTSPEGAAIVISNLPRQIPVLNEEIAILRAFLAQEINAILFEDAK